MHCSDTTPEALYEEPKGTQAAQTADICMSELGVSQANLGELG